MKKVEVNELRMVEAGGSFKFEKPYYGYFGDNLEVGFMSDSGLFVFIFKIKNIFCHVVGFSQGNLFRYSILGPDSDWA